MDSIRRVLRAVLPQGAILLSVLTFAGYLMGLARDRAFARWGGCFYMFVTVFDPELGRHNSQVLMFSPDDGTVTKILDNLPYIIVGAGVSTCAPVIIG